MSHDGYASDEEKKKPSPSPVRAAKYPRRKKQNEELWYTGPYDGVRGETSLWVAVVTQAMMDALSRSPMPEAIYARHEAIIWLTENSRDFHFVCLQAGLDPDYVRRRAKRSLVSPVAWRAAPGEGARYHERRAYRRRLKECGRCAKPPFCHPRESGDPSKRHGRDTPLASQTRRDRSTLSRR